MPADSPSADALSAAQIEQFIADGCVRLDAAFLAPLATEIRDRLWRDLPGAADDPASWTQPVVRLGMYSEPPFLAAASTARLHGAFNQLVGVGRWRLVQALGTFPVRFPHPEDAGDTGWHVDASFGNDDPDFLEWRVNITSRGRALLMLFLFSDIGEAEAPTLIRRGSHRDIALRLAPAGEAGLSLRQLLADGAFDEAPGDETALATGAAGDVWLCHPFLVHAAQPHRGQRPRFLAQPPLLPAKATAIIDWRTDSAPVGRAVRLALEKT